MWYYRRLFVSVLACGLLFGSVFFLRLRLGDRRPVAPDFLPNVARFRTERVCSARALILVSSPPNHAHRRQAIRETWAHPSVTYPLDVSVAFGIGRADGADSQRAVDWEAEIYGDLFYDGEGGGFLQILKAARGACSPPPEFLLKIDDDVFVNTRALADFLGNVETFSSSNSLWCLEWNRKLDSTNTTWIVQSSLSNESIQPAYCLSSVYLLTGKALDSIIRRHESKTSSRLQLPDDVYVTSVLAREGRLSLMVLGDRYVFDPQVEEVDPSKLTLARVGQRAVEAETRKLWSTLVRETLDHSKRFDIGL